MSRSKPKRPASQRQLKVGELIRHALAELFLKEPLYGPGLEGVSITVSEVKVSPDLRNATVYISPMGHAHEDSFLKALNQVVPMLRARVTKQVQLRYSPQLTFRIDKTLDYASRIDQLLKSCQASTTQNTSGTVTADE